MDKLVSVFVGLLKAIPLPLGGSHRGISFFLSWILWSENFGHGTLISLLGVVEKNPCVGETFFVTPQNRN